MEKIVKYITAICFITSLSLTGSFSAYPQDAGSAEEIKIVCPETLGSLVRQWSDAYGEIKPEVRIGIRVIGSGEPYMLPEGDRSVAILDEMDYNGLQDAHHWKITVGRDVVVPVLNTDNPVLSEIKKSGMSAIDMVEMLCKSESPQWGYIDDNARGKAVHCFLLNEKAVKKGMADFVGKPEYEMKAKLQPDAATLLAAVGNDPYSIGFCTLTDIINAENQIAVENICILPIDKNGNGKIDHYERIYGNVNDFCRGVWIGKYPQPLIWNLYAAAVDVPENPELVDFLKWIVTGGQSQLEAFGYTGLVGSEKQSNIEALSRPVIHKATSDNQYALWQIILFIMIILLSGGLIIGLFMRYRKPDGSHGHEPASGPKPNLSEGSVNFPAGLHYDKTHTWAFMEQNGSVRVGIDDFLQKVTGTLTRLKMKNAGETVRKNDPVLWLIQDGKQLTVYSPVSGMIKSVNEGLARHPEKINEAPYGEGWCYSIEPSNWEREVQFLKMADGFRDWLRFEFVRLKDFMAVMAVGSEIKKQQVIFQDGGELLGHVLQNFGPEVWEEFQKNFIDNSGKN